MADNARYGVAPNTVTADPGPTPGSVTLTADVDIRHGSAGYLIELSRLEAWALGSKLLRLSHSATSTREES